MIIKWLNFYKKKKYFQKHNAKKKNIQIIILHVLQLLKKDKKAKQKHEKKKKNKRLCL